MQLTGIHHLTAISADAPGNVQFYTQVLGMRLVKKTVNQDDVSAYHLFYADGEARPGTDLTFFDWPAPREKRGTHSDHPHRAARRRREPAVVEGAARPRPRCATATSPRSTAAPRSSSRTRRASGSR